MSLQITGGSLKGRKIIAPKGESTRPTKGMVKEAFFNICGTSIEEALFLDLFAGSGAMGIEALSRGAKQAIFIDNHPNAIRIIKKNIQELALEKKALVLPFDWKRGVESLHKNGHHFDLIYIDPPYSFTQETKIDILQILFSLSLVNGSVFFEDNSFFLKDHMPVDVRCIREKKYGKSYLLEFQL